MQDSVHTLHSPNLSPYTSHDDVGYRPFFSSPILMRTTSHDLKMLYSMWHNSRVACETMKSSQTEGRNSVANQGLKNV